MVALQRRWGLGALFQGRAALKPARAVPPIPTGFAGLDRRLGGGLPRGTLTEITGRPTSGMTTLALKVMAQAQQQGAGLAYIDLPGTFDPDYADRCGVDVGPNALLLARPQIHTDALAISHGLVKSKSLGLVVVSFATDPLADPAQQPALAAWLRRLINPVAKCPCALLFLIPLSNRSPKDSYSFAAFAGVRLALDKALWIYRHGDIRGYQARVKILKNSAGQTGQTQIKILFNGTVRGDGT